MLEEVVGHVERVYEVPPGVDVDGGARGRADEALAGLLEEARRDPPNPGNANERSRTRSAERLAAFLAGDDPTVVYFGKLLYNKGVHVLLEALQRVDARAVIVGFGDYRAELEAARRPADALHRPARAPPPRPPARARGRHRRPVDLPRGVRDGRGRGGRGRLAAARRAIPGWPRSPRARAGVPAAPALARELHPGDVAELALARLLALPEPIATRCAPLPGPRPSLAGAGRCRAPTSERSTTLRRMGDEQRLGHEELLAAASEGFDTGTDFTVAVEEEFALLDPVTLDLVNRFEEVQAAATGTPLEDHLVGELIASEVEIKTGRCETFAEVPAMAERRAQRGLVDPLGIALGGDRTPVVALARAADHRHAALPPQRPAAALRRLAQQHLRHARAHRHPRRRPRDRRHERPPQLLPELLALSASSPFVENVNTGFHSARTQIFTRFFPAAACRTRSPRGGSTRTTCASSTRRGR